MRKVSWFWLKQNVIIMLINSRMMLISDNLDNDEAHHSLGISKTVNLNLNFAHKKYLISKISWDYYNLKPSRK